MLALSTGFNQLNYAVTALDGFNQLQYIGKIREPCIPHPEYSQDKGLNLASVTKEHDWLKLMTPVIQLFA